MTDAARRAQIEGDYVRANGDVVACPYAQAERWRTHCKDAQSETVRKMADITAIAHAAGLCYEADGHGCNPDPILAIVQEIERLRALDVELQDKAGSDGQ